MISRADRATLDEAFAIAQASAMIEEARIEVAIRKAIAAELRELATKLDATEIDVDAGDFNTSTSLSKAGDILRERADEIDPPPDEPRPPRTVVREFSGQMPKRG